KVPSPCEPHGNLRVITADVEGALLAQHGRDSAAGSAAGRDTDPDPAAPAQLPDRALPDLHRACRPVSRTSHHPRTLATEMTMATQLHETPAPKMPDPALRQKIPTTKEEKIDAQVDQSFPASDPPSYSG